MRILDKASAKELLRRQGVPNKEEIPKVLNCFDFDRLVYEHDFWPDDILYQLIRLPSATIPVPSTGNWFGLAGITNQGVAINDGGSGRRLAVFKVVAPFQAIEGSAKSLPVDLGSAIGGPGGGTQIFIPKSLIGHLQSIGPADRW